MSGLLFLFSVAAFVLIAYWAFRNDATKGDACDSGLLAMTSVGSQAPKSTPKWKKVKTPEAPRQSGRRETVQLAPSWRRTLLYENAR